MGNWLRNYFHCCYDCRHLPCILIPLLGLFLILLGRLPSISIELYYVVGMLTLDTLRGYHQCHFHSIDDRLFIRFFAFLDGIGLIRFRYGALKFMVCLLLLPTVIIILLGNLRRFVDLLLLFWPACSIYYMLELSPSILLYTSVIFLRGSGIRDSVEAYLDTCRDCN